MRKSVDVQQDRKGEGGLVCVGFNGGEGGGVGDGGSECMVRRDGE